MHDLKKPIFEAWTRTSHRVDAEGPSLAGYIHPDRLRSLRDLVLDKPLISEDSLVQSGEENAKEDTVKRKEYEESLKRKKGGTGGKAAESSSRLKATQAAKKAAEPSAVQEMKYADRPSALVSSSHIARTRLGSSASSKLNYIINEVRRSSFSFLTLNLTATVLRYYNIRRQRSF